MSENLHRQKLVGLKTKEADLKKKKGAEERAVSKLREEIGCLERGVTRTTSGSTLKQKSGQIETKSKNAAEGGVKVAKLDADIAKNLGGQRRAQNTLDQTVARRTKKEDVEANKRRDTEMRHAKSLTREAAKQNSPRSAALGNGDLSQLPEKITALFFASNPLDQTQLRLGEEIREVERQIRLSEHRDSVALVPKLAVRTEDLFQAFDQAVARLMVEGIPEEKTPELFAADGVDADQVILVRPESV